MNDWYINYTGAAIYSLVDANGKRYIGQTTNLQRRLKMHKKEIDRLHNDPDAETSEGIKLSEAIRNGMTFDFEVLEYIPWSKATVNELRRLEQHFIDQYGGIENTYNTACIAAPNYGCDFFNNVCLIIDFSDDPDIMNFLEYVEDPESLIKDLIRYHLKST